MFKKLKTDWPFAAGRVPFFYGWVIAVLSTLGFLLSVPGQTMGMAVFAEEFIEVFELTRTELSAAYLFGTIGSALLLTRAGRWYDHYGARVMLLGSAVLLGITLAVISTLDIVAGAISTWLGLSMAWVSFPLILIGYFGVRFAGQGVLTSASRNLLLVWFEKRRGLVAGFRGVFVSLGFSLAPLLLALMIDDFGWRGALWIMAVVVGLGFSLIVLVFVRDHPSQCNLRADGEPLVSSSAHQPLTGHDVGVAQVRRDPVFWMYASALSMHAMFGTAVTFHIVAIFGEAGRSREEAFGYFLPQAIVSLSVNLLASTAADYLRLKPFLLVMLVAFIVGAYGLTQLQSQLGYWLLVVGFGAGGGLWGVLSNLVFVRHYGVLHLGEISGLNTSLTVFASAIGPLLFSVANEQIGSFSSAAVGCLGALVVLLLVGTVLAQPRDLDPRLKLR